MWHQEILKAAGLKPHHHMGSGSCLAVNRLTRFSTSTSVKDSG